MNLSIITYGRGIFMSITLLSLDNVQDFKHYTKYLEFISSERRDRIHSIKFNHNKVTSLLAEMLIRYRIYNDLNLDNRDIVFTYNEYGKPSLKFNANFHFSISHTDNAIVYISDEFPIGIDIESIKVCNLTLAKRFFTPHEYEYIKCSNTPNQDFFKVWTMKESYIKMLGTGLHAPLNSFDVLKPTKNYTYYNTIHNENAISVCGSYNATNHIEIVSMNIENLLNIFCERFKSRQSKNISV